MNENRLSEFLEFFDSEPTNKVFYIIMFFYKNI